MMESQISTFILLAITILLVLSMFSYYSSIASYTYASITPLQEAELYSKDIQITISPVVIGYIVPTSPKQTLNYTVNFVFNAYIPGYEGKIILLPFLTNSTYDPFIYVPPPAYSGYINQVSKPNSVGYVKAVVNGTTLTPYNFFALVNLISQQAIVNGYAFNVTNGANVNFTFVSKPGLIPEIWVILFIQGKYFRIAYPYISVNYFINTEEGFISLGNPMNIYQYMVSTLGSFAFINYNSLTGSWTINGNAKINVSKSTIAFINGTTIDLIGSPIFIASWFNYTSAVKLSITGTPTLPPQGNYVPKYLPINNISNLIYNYYNPYTYQIEYEQNISKQMTNPTYNTTTSITVPQTGLTFNGPIIFTQPVTFQSSTSTPVTVIFNGPVVFENSFTVDGNINFEFNGPVVFENSVGINSPGNYTFNEGALFNSSAIGVSISMTASNINITVNNGPFLINITGLDSAVYLGGGSNGLVINANNNLISIRAYQVELEGNVKTISYMPVYLLAWGPVSTNGVTFLSNVGLKVNSMLLINATSQVIFNGGNVVNITNGPLIIYGGNTFNWIGNGNISVYGPILISAKTIEFDGDVYTSSYMYQIYYTPTLDILNNPVFTVINKVLKVPPYLDKIVIGQGINVNPGNMVGMAGWLSVLPQNITTNIISFSVQSLDKNYTVNVYEVPINMSYFKLSVYEGTKLLASATYPFYTYLFFNVSLYYPTQGTPLLSVYIISQNNTYSQVKSSITLSVPNSAGFTFTLGYEPVSQFLLYISPTSINSLISQLQSYGPFVIMNITSNYNSQLLQYYYLILPQGLYNSIVPMYSYVNISQTPIFEVLYAYSI